MILAVTVVPLHSYIYLCRQSIYNVSVSAAIYDAPYTLPSLRTNCIREIDASIKGYRSEGQPHRALLRTLSLQYVDSCLVCCVIAPNSLLFVHRKRYYILLGRKAV